MRQQSNRLEEDYDDAEQIDTSIGKRGNLQRFKDQSDSNIDPDRAAAARQIFADPSELIERVTAA